MDYRLAYAIGFNPWEDAEHEPAFVGALGELLDREELDRRPPYGRALDLGTGSGIWGIELARRGWEVTGIDYVAKALRRARDRVREAGVDLRLVQGDVTRLRDAGVGTGFRLLLDTGTYHGLDPRQRRAMARQVDGVAAPDATVLLLVWDRRRRGPLPGGATRNDVEADFPGWKVTDVVPSHFRAPRLVEALLTPDEHWYRLRRE